MPNVQLLQRLNDLQQQGTMFGHQDDPFYGIGWAYEDGRSDVLETCGDWPSVMGFDLGGIEMGDTKNLDSVPFDRIREEIQNHHRRGGIITISWHPRNPVTGGTAWDATDGVVTAILADGPTHDLFLTWLERVRTFFTTLTDDNGNAIPLIFRPWHENNGAWFWWGDRHCTPEEYKALWNLTQDQIINHKSQITNILWSYSPNLQGGFTDSLFIPRYPGDDRVDMIGLDAYQWGTEEDYVRQASADLDYLCAYGADHHKLVALTECGFKNNPDPTWWHRVLLPMMKKYPLSYALVWRNAETEHFGPVPNTDNGSEFMPLYNDPSMLFLNDIVPLPFVRQQAGQFWLNGAPYRYIGTNFWYGAILASKGQGGNRERLIAELDSLHALGLDNLRILVGSDGERGVKTKVEPTLQIAPGVYNDTILDGLDYLLAEMAKRDMKAVLYLNNSWEWSGGYGFYLEHAGYGVAPRPEEAGYQAFMNHVAQFADAPEAQALFYDYVRFIVSRTNRYTQQAYTAGSPTVGRDAYYAHIFSLVANEPLIAGANFWAWGGYAQPQHPQWQVGDDYTGDPAQEPQGLNSVFITDSSTIAIILSAAVDK